MNDLVASEKPDVVMHLAAYAGVRHSMDNARDYIENNIIGTQNLIEACESNGVTKIVYASTSCVMAGNALPWKEDEPTNHQLNPYGYSKRTNECQFKVAKIEKIIGLRFFTVYGPWGRPDMALFTFTKNILDSKPIDVFNYGDMKRDFTYVDDIVQGIGIVIDRVLSVDNSINEIYNIGYGQQVDLMEFIHEIEKNFERVADKNMLPIHPADTQETWSDTTKLKALGYQPTTPVSVGIEKFASWYKSYNGPVPAGVEITIRRPNVSGWPTLGLKRLVISCNVSCVYNAASSATQTPTFRPRKFSRCSALLQRMNTPLGNLIVSSLLFISLPSTNPKYSMQLRLSDSQISDLIIAPVGAL